MQRVSQGDQLAFASLYNATRSLVYGLAMRMLRDQSAAEDVTIEVYLQVYQQAGQYTSDRGTPLAWILTLARSRAIDRLRQTTLQQQRESPLESIAFASPLPDPETSSAANELRRAVRKALAMLSKEQRQVIEIAYYTGLSHREIAAQLEKPLGTVKTRIRTGMVVLRAQLSPLLADQGSSLRRTTEVA
jgi:RNA polymerase sigma-70 factor (ECF subfamily)